MALPTKPGAAPMAPADDPAEERQEQLLGAVDNGLEEAAENPDEERRKQAEIAAVKALWKEYEQAREFDKRARAQYAVDRRYAAGTAIITWAVSANLIGAFIDILVSFLYARNPDVSISKAPRVDPTGTQQEDDFAKTSELVVSALWTAPTTRLKDRIREMIRSVLTTGIGWAKVIMVCKGQNIPEMKTQLNDIRDNIKRLEALRQQVTVDANGNQVYLDDNNEVLTQEQLDAKTAEYNALQESVSNRMEVAMRKALAIDFVASEDLQVSLDVRQVTDYPNAKWMANRIFRPTTELKAMFPALGEKDIKGAKVYHQKALKNITDLSDNVKLTGIADDSVRPEEADQYTASGTTGVSASVSGEGEQGPGFACIVELWNRHDGHVYTMIDGVDKWAKQPYQPDYPSSRFFPFFGIGFYPADGARHPQSLAWRLRELQDEYCSTRSSLRLTRSRAIPGTVFNRSSIKPEDAAKLERSVHQELIGIEMPPDANIRNAFAEKPISVGDMRLYDTAPILQDMEKLSGVQEALQSSITTEKTATEAEIQQSGFAARTTADRDILEGMLADMAHYTLELALSALDPADVQRYAGAKAFWPAGMAIDDLLTLVEVKIEAGTTGKPKLQGDKAAWGTVLPILTQAVQQIQAAQMTGNVPLANALTEIVKETMRRMGDETDPSRFIPQMPAAMPGMGGPPGMGPPGMPPPGAGGPPGAPPPDAGGPPPGAEDPNSLGALVAPPELTPPELTPPM